MSSKIKTINVSTAHSSAGILARESEYVFTYTPGNKVPISITMPVRHKSYSQKILPSIFEMNLPEGFIRHYIIERLRKQVSVDDMLFLALTGKNGVGGIQFEHPDWSPNNGPGLTLKEILSNKDKNYFASLIDTYLLQSCGISGIQPKILTPEKGTFKGSELIIKKGSSDFKDIVLNEFLCLSIARNAGIATPDFWLSDNQELLALRRFDRTEKGSLFVEDMTVLMGKTSDQKYQGSYENLMKVADLYQLDKQALFERIALSLILGDGDAHLKNFSIIYSDPTEYKTLKWSPAYDIVHTRSYNLTDTPALKFMGKKKFPTRAMLELFAKKHAIKNARQTIERISDSAVDTLNKYNDKNNAIVLSIRKQL